MNLLPGKKYYKQDTEEVVVTAKLDSLRLRCYFCVGKGHTQSYTVSSFYQKHRDCTENWCYADLEDLKRKKVPRRKRDLPEDVDQEEEQARGVVGEPSMNGGGDVNMRRMKARQRMKLPVSGKKDHGNVLN